ncbi:hypothetical protein FACS1894185_2070 [Betaproteobacteria bacterium]|nr:hypothetical protein FACS1894185_2070 [Betaproteobacteria bacterium]GHU13278.1 hypothetical protein FACS189441_0420 [Betaproteobacteria bacterium]
MIGADGQDTTIRWHIALGTEMKSKGTYFPYKRLVTTRKSKIGECYGKGGAELGNKFHFA